MEHQIKLYYGIQDGECGVYHSFLAVDPDDTVDEGEAATRLAEQLDCAPGDEDFAYNSMYIALPPSVVEAIKAEGVADYIEKGSCPVGIPQRMETPFQNDPFAIIWIAFKNLYPGKKCSVYYDVHEKGADDEAYGYTEFPDDGADPVVVIYSEPDTNIQAEILAHELAHVAVGKDHEHDGKWEAAFDAINKEYNRIESLLFAAPEEGRGLAWET